ncbi:uncharacterized protein LOC116204543 isoform X2 [Punica granatum]|uniref:Uncharacterized protein LOC116204543 isoform X2 n=1 Tax=Punica granatum TaxID=22663 RepID=A0A6P8DLI9_PUNGR|nr:uncharacterized protein LOC116204543 isoform X2 [Punica granatum]
MARIAPPPKTSSVAAVAILLLLTTALPPPAASSLSYTNYRILLSLSHSLATRVANLRRARGDLDGYGRAAAIADRLERVMGLGFWRLMGSVGWDYVRNYSWGRDLDYWELYEAVPELNELLGLLGEYSRGRTDAERAAWVGRNYGSVLRASKSIVGRLLRVFSKAGPMKEAVETLRREVVEGDFLRDCLELGTDDLKGLIQILKDLAVQYYSSPDGQLILPPLALQHQPAGLEGLV